MAYLKTLLTFSEVFSLRGILIDMSDAAISFTVHSHEHKDRSNDWYWTLGLLAIGGAGISVFLGNVLLAVIIIVGAGSLWTLAVRGPRLHGVKIDQRGVSMDGTLYTFASIDSFWVEESEAPRLLLSTKGILHPQLVIDLETPERGVEVRTHLRRFVKEEEQEPHLGERLADIFGL